MKVLLIAIMVFIINMCCIKGKSQIAIKKYNTLLRDTVVPPNASVPPSAVNGNGTPILPPDTSRGTIIDTSHTMH
jgi:hypothetical protein